MMLDKIKKALDLLSQKWEETEGVDEKGNKIKAIVIKHGQYKVLAVPVNECCAAVIFTTPIRPQDGELLSKKDKKFQEKFYTILKREILEGRSAFRLHFDKSKNPPILQALEVSQIVVFKDLEPITLQRFSDAIHEVVIVSIRGHVILGQTFNSASGITPSIGDNPMYR